jgi:hypothetical protein
MKMTIKIIMGVFCAKKVGTDISKTVVIEGLFKISQSHRTDLKVKLDGTR